MSHFTVMVISTKGKKGVDAALAPYQENNMGDCPSEYMEFVDQEDEFKEEWETGEVDGVSFKEKYKSFEEFCSKWHGHESREENEDGEERYGYYHNPNAKWDWFQVGGRWAGMLRLKEGAKLRAEPQPSWGWTEEDKKELKNGNVADMGRKSEIDWEGMMEDGKQKAEKLWAKVANICGVDDRGHIKQPEFSWEAIREQHKDNIDAARKAYHEQPEVKAFSETKAGGIWGSVSDFDCTQEEYGRRGANNAISTFAVLLDGEWKEKGEMGWFGMSSATDEDERQWSDSFYDSFIKNLPDNAFITVVDCHI